MAERRLLFVAEGVRPIKATNHHPQRVDHANKGLDVVNALIFVGPCSGQ